MLFPSIVLKDSKARLDIEIVQRKARKRTARKKRMVDMFLLGVYMSAAGMLPNRTLPKFSSI